MSLKVSFCQTVNRFLIYSHRKLKLGANLKILNIWSVTAGALAVACSCTKTNIGGDQQLPQFIVCGDICPEKAKKRRKKL